MTSWVRNALPEDAVPLLDLIHQHATFERAAAQVGESDLARILEAEKPPTHLLVSENHEGLLGYAAITFDYALWSAGRFAHLDCLFVRASARGEGTGRRLFERACLLASEAGAQRIEWQTPVWNADAIRFYERQGGIGQPKMRFNAKLRALNPEMQGPDEAMKPA